jgi:hypothetical protein
MTEFYLNVDWRFYMKHPFIPSTGDNRLMTDHEHGIVCVTMSNENKALPYNIYFDTQENMMSFQLKYL